MDDLDGLSFLGETFDSFRITFVRSVEEQEVFRRFGGYPSLAWSLPLGGESDDIAELLEQRLNELDEEELGKLLGGEERVSFQTWRGRVTVPGGKPLPGEKVGSVLHIGRCSGWTFALELYGPYEPTQRLLEEISSGTTAVSVERISAKWLRCLDWAEDGVWKGGGEASSGPFDPPLQALIEQAGVNLEEEDCDLGASLFAPILSSAFGIRLSLEMVEQSLFTGAFLFPSVMAHRAASPDAGWHRWYE